MADQEQSEAAGARVLPSCTVIVPTYNRASGLRRLLAALGQQDIAMNSFEVIVVDDGSTSTTASLLDQVRPPFPLHVLRQRNQGPAAARNTGVRAAVGEVLVFLDDDVAPAPDLLRLHLEVHAAHARVAALGVMALPKADGERRLAPWAEWEAVALAKQYQAMLQGRWAPTPRQFYTANASVRREHVLAAGLFDPAFRRAEDVELAYRLRDLGLTFRFLPAAIVYHRPGRPYEAWRRIAGQYGFYDVVMWRDKGRSHIVPVMRREFGDRHRSLQLAARLLVGRRRLLRLFTASATATAGLVSAAGLRRPALAAYSAIFNLLYYQGACDALGGREAFWSALGSGRTTGTALVGRKPG